MNPVRPPAQKVQVAQQPPRIEEARSKVQKVREVSAPARAAPARAVSRHAAWCWRRAVLLEVAWLDLVLNLLEEQSVVGLNGDCNKKGTASADLVHD